MIECSNKIPVDESVVIPAWTRPVQGMNVIFADREDQYRIQQTRDIVYCVHGRPLKLHLFTHWTPIPGKKYPLVLFVRGSGWLKQDIDGFLPQLTDIARAGYIVAAMEYRHTEERCGFPAQIEDAKAAIHFLQEHAEDYDIDAERIAIWGDSAGAHTALMTGFTDGTDLLCAPEELGLPLNIKCIVDVFGPGDFTTFCNDPCGVDNVSEDSPMNLFFNNAMHSYDDIRATASPVSYVSKERKLPPTLIIHGDRDPMVPFSQSVTLYEKMRDNDQEVDFYMIRNAKHGTYIWTKKIIQLIIDFLGAHL